MDNYRGIAITSVLGKVFEKVLLCKMEELNKDQSDLQFGFTKGLSPVMASLILSEAIADSTSNNEPLYIATLDSQKAFDIVHHQILIKKIIPSRRYWPTVQSMYTGITGKVKWAGEVSESFMIQQGVRQGGILSTHFYKPYINDLLLDLEDRRLGKHIGTVYAGCPTCADDVLLMSADPVELQSMLDLAGSYSNEHRYHIHPLKSVVIRRVMNNKWQQKEKISDWHIGQTEVTVQSRTSHLGLTRTNEHESTVKYRRADQTRQAHSIRTDETGFTEQME